jgi:hypothetical protein
MTATEFALIVGSVLCIIGFAAMVVVLLRMLRALGELRGEVWLLREETRPLLAELRQSVDNARDDLDRFDRVLGSAEAISSSVEGVSRVAKIALSAPLIKTVALASGTGRAARRLRGRDDVAPKRRARG